MKWVICDGQRVRVWVDSWLPGTTNNAPTGPGSSALPNLLVKDLASDIIHWDTPKIEALVNPEYLPKILTI